MPYLTLVKTAIGEAQGTTFTVRLPFVKAGGDLSDSIAQQLG
ncbi:hypothetical protein [Phormidesmis priestleyi]|nr:hypothetical protein [Phormidesmis priestleyi]